MTIINEVSEAVISRLRGECGSLEFCEETLEKMYWFLSETQKQSLALLRRTDQTLAAEIEQLWRQGRSFRRFEHLSDEQMCRIMNGLNKAGLELQSQVEAADMEVDRIVHAEN